MELTKKTTILFSPDQHRRLSALAARQGRSLGELVREACEAQYGLAGGTDQVSAVDELARMDLPVATPEIMKKQSQAAPGDLLP